MQRIVVSDKSGRSPAELFNAVWALNYQALYHYNRSPWVERQYSAPIESVQTLPEGVPVPAGAWMIELVVSIEEAGALGFHEDNAANKTRKSSEHSLRGVSATETPYAVVGVKTSEEAGVPWTEVASHELMEMIVDPYVVDEARIRKYLNHADREWYIGEVGDPVQETGYDVGAPEGRNAGVVLSNFAYPSWWEQPETRAATSFCSDSTAWKSQLPPLANLPKWTLAPGGYMSVAPEASPSEWSQIFGAEHKPDRS